LPPPPDGGISFQDYYGRVADRMASFGCLAMNETLLDTLRVRARPYSARIVSCVQTIALNSLLSKVMASMARLVKGDPALPAPPLDVILTTVSRDLLAEGARPRLVAAVEPLTERARPKILQFADPDGGEPEYGIWVNGRLLLYDRYDLALLCVWYTPARISGR
jgi:hypothetical protein